MTNATIRVQAYACAVVRELVIAINCFYIAPYCNALCLNTQHFLILTRTRTRVRVCVCVILLKILC